MGRASGSESELQLAAQRTARFPFVRASAEAEQLLADNGLDRVGVIALSLVGSRAYGLAHEGSDRDYRGIYLPHTEDVLALSPAGAKTRFAPPPEQYERKDPDLAIFEIGKFMRLAAASDPNVLEILWAPSLEHSAEGQLLRERRAMFLSERVRHTYAGYAHSQLQKLRNIEQERPEKREKFARHLFRLFEQGRQLLEQGDMSIEVADPEELRTKSRWPLERIEAEFALLEDEFATLETVLPWGPDWDQINATIIAFRLAQLERG
jgi:predicted nucleotidyltransferase